MENKFLSVRVNRKYKAAKNIVCLELCALDGNDLPIYQPGAHIDVHLPGGLIRQFSLFGDPNKSSSYEIAVLLEPESRGGSVAVHDKVLIGDTLQISEPRNHFSLVDASKSIFFAGGIGITPILCMVRHLQSINADYTLHYSCRSQEKAAFLTELQPMVEQENVILHFDDQPNTNFDFTAVLESVKNKNDTHIYACGPSGFIEAIKTNTINSGFAADNFHFEHFSLAAEDKPVIADDDFAFQVELASTGEIFDIPADESITSALDRQGVYIPVSCEEGICGTCLTGVVSGKPDHRDTYLTEEEHALNDQFTPCCSRSYDKKIIIDL